MAELSRRVLIRPISWLWNFNFDEFREVPWQFYKREGERKRVNLNHIKVLITE